MDSKLTAFIAEYLNKNGVGDTPANKGTCVGLIELWLDFIGYPHIWGNAIDLPQEADKDFYDVIKNTRDNFPVPGDVLTRGKPYGPYIVEKPDGTKETRYFGHTMLVKGADVNNVTVVEQNNPLGSGVRISTYKYSDDMVWIHPKNFNADVPPPPQDNTPTPPESLDSVDINREYLQSELPVALFNKGNNEIVTIGDTIYQIIVNTNGTRTFIHPTKTAAAPVEETPEPEVPVAAAPTPPLTPEPVEASLPVDNGSGTVGEYKQLYENAMTELTKFKVLGYATADDLKKDLKAKNDIHWNMVQDQIALHKKIEGLADSIGSEAHNSYAALEEAYNQKDEFKQLKEVVQEAAQELGIDHPSRTSIMSRIFFFKETAEKWIKQKEDEAVVKQVLKNPQGQLTYKKPLTTTMLRTLLGIKTGKGVQQSG